MFTSFFDNFKDCPNGQYNEYKLISIAGWHPQWFKGQTERKFLAPKKWFYDKYKKDGDKNFYIAKYDELVLSGVDLKELYTRLGDNTILLCWEAPGEFCHRRLVAEAIKRTLGISAPEYIIRESRTTTSKSLYTVQQKPKEIITL